MNYFQRLVAKILNIPVQTGKAKKVPKSPYSAPNMILQGLQSEGHGTMYNYDLKTLHQVYDFMDRGSLELSTYLDTISEEATFVVENSCVTVECSFHDLKVKLESALERWEIDLKIRDYARLLAKYGRLVVKPVYGYSNGVPYIVRLEDGLSKETPDVLSKHILKDLDEDGNWIGWKNITTGEKFPIHHYVEFKLGSTLWGRSLLFGLEDYWPELNLLEKNLDLYRAGRPPLFLIHKLSLANLDPSEYANLVNWAKYFTEISSTLTASNTPPGEIQRPNTGSAVQSLFLPRTTFNENDGLEILENNPNIKDIKDIEYKRSKLLGKLALPKSYVTGEEIQFATLSGTDPRILRRVLYLQKSLLQGIDILLQFELALLNVSLNKWDYVIKLPRNLDVLELRNLDKLRVVLDVFSSLQDLGGPLEKDEKEWTTFLVKDFLSYYLGDILERFEKSKSLDQIHVKRFTEHKRSLLPFAKTFKDGTFRNKLMEEFNSHNN